MRNIRPIKVAAGFAFACIVFALMAGCGKKQKPAKPVDVTPRVQAVRAQKRDITRTIGQPGFIYAYEQTAIYPKIAGYVLKWRVDIGDTIDEKQEIATLYVPELEAEVEQKKAQVKLDEAQIAVAERVVETVEKAIVEAAARVKQNRADVAKFEASVERWESEVERLFGLTGMGVVDKQVLDESRKQLKANKAAHDAAAAAVDVALASVEARKSDLDKAKADVVAAGVKAQVARKDLGRVEALFSYTHILAPYKGVVVVRNANTGDYLQPGSGDESVRTATPGTVASHQPLYVVARTDVVRVYVDVPEADASSVAKGTPVQVTVQSLGNEVFSKSVKRTSWSLHRDTRTLRAEIDLENPDKRLLPNMYAYGRVDIKKTDVWALPAASVIELGNHNCCFILENGKAVRTPVQMGISDGKWIEVTKKQVKDKWIDFNGDEEIIVGELSELSDGESVKLSDEKTPTSSKK